MMNGNGSGMSFGVGFMILGLLFMLALIVGIVLLIVWLVRKSNSQSSVSGSPVEILKSRYAKGDIDKTEFEEKMKDLSIEKR
jgi:putative membrane protein